MEAKSRKYQGVFRVKSREKTRQVLEYWSQQLEHEQVPKSGTEPGVRNGTRSLLTCHNRCKRSMVTTRNPVKVKLGIKVMKLEESLIGWDVTVTGQGSGCHLKLVRGGFILLNKIPVSTIKLPEGRFQDNRYARILQGYAILQGYEFQDDIHYPRNQT